MSTTLFQQSIGLVDIYPQELFLETTLGFSAITSPGFIQEVALAESIALSDSFVVNASYSDGAGGVLTNVFVPIFNGSVITLDYAGYPLAEGAVLLNPGHDQTISSGNLTIDNGLKAASINVNDAYDLPTDAPPVTGYTIIGNTDGSTSWGPNSSLTGAVLLNPTGFQEITNYQLQIDKGLQVGSNTDVGSINFYGGTSGTAFVWSGSPNASILYAPTFTNEPFGQNSKVSVPDPETLTANFVLNTDTATPGNLAQYSTVTGLISDSGIPSSSIGGAVLLAPTGAQEITGYSLQIDKGVIVGDSSAAGLLQFLNGTTGNTALQILAAPNASTSFRASITNASFGQSSTLTIPDPVSATANMALTTGSLVSGNLPSFNGTTGVLEDSGIASSSITPTVISSITISPTAFTYFNIITTGAIIWVSSSAPNTQSAFVGGPTNDYGTYPFKATAGTYNFGIIYTEGLGNGILRLVVNGSTTVDIDQYGTNINQYDSHQFSATLVDGDNTLQVLTNGKNASAGNYFINFAGDIVINRM